MDPNTALAVLTFFLFLATAYYAWEARQAREVSQRNLDELVKSRQVAEDAVAEAARSRLVSEQSLAELRAQNARGYEAHVRVTNYASGNKNSVLGSKIEVTNLGPSPATDIVIRTVYVQPTKETHYFKNVIAGLPAQQSVSVTLEPTVENFYDWHHDLRPGNYTIEVNSKTVLGEAMPTQVQYLFVTVRSYAVL